MLHWPNHPAVQYHRLSLERVVQETADARSFVLAVPPDLKERFAYRAGQFLTFRVPWEGGSLIRCYSLSSCPVSEAGEWKVTVKRIEDGRISNWFNGRLAPGAELEVLPPAGRFVLRDSRAPLLLFGGGSGITPVASLIKTALATTQRRIRLVYANQDRDSIIFAGELEALAAAHGDRFEVIQHLDDSQGFLDVAGATAHGAGFEDGHAYLCGPGPFMDVVEKGLSARGFDSDRIFIERFESPADGMAPEVVRTAQEAAEEVPVEILVHLDGREHRVPYSAGQSVLRAAIAAGLDPPFACEEGYCGTCAAKRVQGKLTMVANEVFNAAEVAEGWILTCQARATGGSCEVRYED